MDLRKEIQVALNSCQPNINRVDKIEAIAKKYADYKQALQLLQTDVSGSVANIVGRNCPFCGEPCNECSHKATDH